jgi:hypothetical protein
MDYLQIDKPDSDNAGAVEENDDHLTLYFLVQSFVHALDEAVREALRNGNTFRSQDITSTICTTVASQNTAALQNEGPITMDTPLQRPAFNSEQLKHKLFQFTLELEDALDDVIQARGESARDSMWADSNVWLGEVQ